MASHQCQGFKAGETKGRTQEKTEHAIGAVKDKANESKDRASETAQAARGHAQQTKGSTAPKTSETAQDAKERAGDAKDNTGSFLPNKTGAAKEKASDAAQYTKETTQAGAQKTGGMLSSATEQVTEFKERKPEMTSEIMAFRDYLLSSTVSDILDVWELKDLGHQTAQRIVHDSDPLQSMQEINQNIPTVVSSLSHMNKGGGAACKSSVLQLLILMVLGIHLMQSKEKERLPDPDHNLDPMDNHISFQRGDMGAMEQKLKKRNIKYKKMNVGDDDKGGIDQLFFRIQMVLW